MSLASDCSATLEAFCAAYVAMMATPPPFRNHEGIHDVLTRRMATANAAAFVARPGRKPPTGKLLSAAECAAELERLAS